MLDAFAAVDAIGAGLVPDAFAAVDAIGAGLVPDAFAAVDAIGAPAFAIGRVAEVLACAHKDGLEEALGSEVVHKATACRGR